MLDLDVSVSNLDGLNRSAGLVELSIHLPNGLTLSETVLEDVLGDELRLLQAIHALAERAEPLLVGA